MISILDEARPEVEAETEMGEASAMMMVEIDDPDDLFAFVAGVRVHTKKSELWGGCIRCAESLLFVVMS